MDLFQTLYRKNQFIYSEKGFQEDLDRLLKTTESSFKTSLPTLMREYLIQDFSYGYSFYAQKIFCPLGEFLLSEKWLKTLGIPHSFSHQWLENLKHFFHLQLQKDNGLIQEIVARVVASLEKERLEFGLSLFLNEHLSFFKNSILSEESEDSQFDSINETLKSCLEHIQNYWKGFGDDALLFLRFFSLNHTLAQPNTNKQETHNLNDYKNIIFILKKIHELQNPTVELKKLESLIKKENADLNSSEKYTECIEDLMSLNLIQKIQITPKGLKGYILTPRGLRIFAKN